MVACVHNLGSKGAMQLKDIFSSSNRSHVFQLDVTEEKSVEALEQFVRNLLETNKELGR